MESKPTPGSSCCLSRAEDGGAGQLELPPCIRVGGSGWELGGEAHWSMAPASWHLWERVQQVAVTLQAPESKRRLSEDGFARVPPPCSCQALLYKTQRLQRSSPWPSHTSALLPACRDPHCPPDMRVLCVVFAVLLLFSMAVPGKGATPSPGLRAHSL